MKMVTAAYIDTPVLTRARIADYLALTKPRVAVLVLFTVAIGALWAAGGGVDPQILWHVVFGTGLVAAGASALNQWLERPSDALMHRTENRPLPAGRLHPLEALALGVALGAVGIVYLAVTLHQFQTPLLAAVTFASYVFVYTPLKRLTPLNTLIGAVPGALPPLIGWTAVRGTLNIEAFALFLILFLWQVPHFLAIAWIYKDDYARAGYRMLPVVDQDGVQTGRNMIVYCLALIPTSLLPAMLGMTGVVYLSGAILLGLVFLACAIGFSLAATTIWARRVMRASLVYLPALLALLVLDSRFPSLLGV